MSNAYLSPILNDAQFNDDGTFLAGGLIWFYAAGTSTPIAAYTGPTASTAWSNPIVLDARGETGGEIWLTASQGYKMILETPPEYGQTHGVVISTFDNISGVNDPVTSTIDSWLLFSGAPVRLSNTSFSVSGDQRNIFQINRRLKCIDGASTIYSTIKGSTYAAGITTVTVVNDSGALDSNLAQVYYSFVETNPSAIPKAVLTGSKTTSTSSDIYISVSGGRLQQAVDAGAPSNAWPINVTGDVTGNVTGNLTGTATLATNCTNAIGYNQTWQFLNLSRSLNTNYTNSTGKPIEVSVSAHTSNNYAAYVAYVDSVRAGQSGGGPATDYQGSLIFIVPNGSVYKIDTGGATYIVDDWSELR